MTALWLAALLAVAAQASGGYRVAGEVLNSASGQPVPGARVTLVPADRGGPGASAVTGDDGRFSFTGLPEGKYDLSGQRRGLLPSHRMGAIVTGPGQDTSSIVLRLPPPAVISGKVVDDAGDPVADAQVELLGSRIVEGRRRMIQESIGRTDDLGAYRFASLPAGGYYLVVSGVPWYTKFNPALGDTAPRAMTHAGYGIRYYPNAADPAAAEPLILKAGQEAEANFTLLPVPAVTVEVHCEQFENLTKHYALTMRGPIRKPGTRPQRDRDRRPVSFLERDSRALHPANRSHGRAKHMVCHQRARRSRLGYRSRCGPPPGTVSERDRRSGK